MSTVFVPDATPAFTDRYNRSTFAFSHVLDALEMFDVREILAMSARLPDQAYYSTVATSVGDGWKRLGDRRPSLAETLETMAETNSLVLLKHCEKDPKTGSVFRRLMDEMVERVGDPLRFDLETGRATVIISSPARVTSYHIDAEVNFLLQVRGHKLLHVFDPEDRSILSEPELEAFYGGDADGAAYKQEREGEARVFPLKPGMGVHLPLHAPHWAQNLHDVSVGVSINFSLRSGARLAKLYKVNGKLRRAGLRPSEPGTSGWQDELKLAAFTSLTNMRNLLRPAVPKAAAH